jgi:hypothetical protein
MTVFEASPRVLETAADILERHAHGGLIMRQELFKLAEQMRKEARQGMERGIKL